MNKRLQAETPVNGSTGQAAAETDALLPATFSLRSVSTRQATAPSKENSIFMLNLLISANETAWETDQLMRMDVS
jgi:hypothetical protein